MHNSIKEANQAHECSQAVVDKFIASGGKVNKAPVTTRNIKKGTINKKSMIKRKLSKSMADAKKRFLDALETHGALTSNELVDCTGYEKSTVFNAAKELENKKIIKRVKGKKPTDLTVFKLIQRAI